MSLVHKKDAGFLHTAFFLGSCADAEMHQPLVPGAGTCKGLGIDIPMQETAALPRADHSAFGSGWMIKGVPRMLTQCMIHFSTSSSQSCCI